MSLVGTIFQTNLKAQAPKDSRRGKSLSSNSKNYHKKVASVPQRLRLPTECMARFQQIYNCLKCSTTDVFCWLFQKCNGDILDLVAENVSNNPPVPLPNSPLADPLLTLGLQDVVPSFPCLFYLLCQESPFPLAPCLVVRHYAQTMHGHLTMASLTWKYLVDGQIDEQTSL